MTTVMSCAVENNSPSSLELQRARLCQYHREQLESCNNTYTDLLTELFFLQHGGNYMDFVQFKKRPSQQLSVYLDQNSLVNNDGMKRRISSEKTSSVSVGDNPKEKLNLAKPLVRPMLESASGNTAEEGASSDGSSSKLKTKQSSRNILSESFEDGIGTQEEILERAKQEAIVLRRVAELRKQGLWSQRRMPKVQEPPRNKVHWDYLLEEMRWLAADFSQERKWKRAAARKLVRMVSNYHKDEKEREKRAEREERQKLRRIASNIARQVRFFWSDIEKVVEYKQRSLLDEKRKKALDLHLNFIVDQTAKYSDWLTQGLNQPGDSKPVSPSVSRTSSSAGSDDDFLPQGASSDDEETIEVEESTEQENIEDEVALLKQESELPFAELLSQLPKDLVENIDKPFSPIPVEKKVLSEEKGTASEPTSQEDENTSSEDESKLAPISLRRSARKRHSEDEPEVDPKKSKVEEESAPDDEEFDVGSGSSDDEATMQEQEEAEEVDHKKEIEDLQAEGDMPIEELMKLYGAGDSLQLSSEAKSEENSISSESEASDEEVFSESDTEEIGMDYLLKTDLDNKGPKVEKEGSPSKEITDVAAEAMSLQPTGHTLATTQVVTPIPSLLRHQLREYQHIGLDWLVTMYDKRLNGILADEMGLGKTIQTIALLAHLACDKGIWGPHLIVVPTSVMLNWEMELKKWCPGFKILTYYGTQKERKMKRTGWTKSNAFHVCITSYKLVLQDHSSFRRKKWRYLILDEAQNIKNFKSQRWQTLLNFNSQRRLLLTGTPLQNNLMELWSLMHFLMPHVFQSHKEFKEWFANPMTGMIEGAQEFNEKLVKRLHKVLRPFLLRRIKKDVEKQMPNKYEHVVTCHLSKRQRFLYEDFMSRAATKETLAGGHFMSVINVLMQLRKVCNHPNLFEPRPILSSLATPPLHLSVPSIVYKALEKGPFKEFKLEDVNLHLLTLSELNSHDFDLLKRLRTPSKLIQDVDASTEKPISDSKPSVSDRIRSLIREKLNVQYQTGGAHKSLSKSNIETSANLRTNSQTGTNDGPTAAGDSDPSRSSTQSITLQYQTAQGPRWATIPNGQIRHLPGGVVQIVTSGSTPRSVTPSSAQQAGTDATEKDLRKMSSSSYSQWLAKRKAAKRQELLLGLSRLNERRCQPESSYMPANLVRLLRSITGWRNGNAVLLPTSAARTSMSSQEEIKNSMLSKFIKTSDSRLQEMKELLDRFVFVIPKVSSSPVQARISHATPWRRYSLKKSLHKTRGWLARALTPYHRIIQNTRVLFPETRLIEYDCGKLQVLNTLLRRFWDEKHRILIFTQMTKVLDILEAFLSYHGYRYLRLDGSTPIEQRMGRMERFNNDPRIFCFILSTRSGGIGVNLTGADTVVFYDSDWNPTMDAQAQDRCHRIGQTRDVHIYRLISEKTVEENILKKANQKRLLGNLAIEGGGFTTAFFKEQQIRDLFADPSGFEELTEQPKLTARQKAIEASKAQNEAKPDEEGEKELEQALRENEETEDAAAAEMLKQEQDALLEEFVDSEEKEKKVESVRGAMPKLAKGSRVEEEMKTIYDELSPIERYALNYLELSAEATNDMELVQAELQVEQSKKEWELTHLMALKEEEERRTEEHDEIFYTREGNQMFVDELTGEEMPTWFPPTPPRDDDIYVDSSDLLLYSHTPMNEDMLSNVIVKKERKRPKLESRPHVPHRKIPRLEVKVPKSLFHRQSILKKKDKPLKLKLAKPGKVPLTGGVIKPAQAVGGLENVPPSKSSPATSAPHSEWIVNEDWVLLQAVQQVLEMPLSLVTLMPAHTPNWHLVADLVNAISCVYRSPKECKQRFESVIVPREEGKSTLTPKKKVKSLKFPVKTKSSKSQQMQAIYSSDNNAQFSSLCSNRFDACKMICSKRTPPSRSTATSGQFQRNPKHTNILHDCGIKYDSPLTPVQISAIKTQRLSNQKKIDASAASQTSQTVTITSNLPQCVSTMAQRVSGALVVSGSPVVGKVGIQAGPNQLTAIPLSVGPNSIVVNSPFSRRQSQPAMQAAKLQAGKGGAAALTLRTLPGGTHQHLQIPQPISSVQSVSLTFSTQSPVVTITTAAPGGKLSAIQHIRQAKQQSAQLVKQQIKQVCVSQQPINLPPQSAATLMSAPSIVSGKKVQLAKMTRPVTQQELELLMKQRSQLKTVQHRPSQVNIAPIQAQVQAQHIRSHAAQQASQHSSKPLPISVPVSAVSITGLNVASSVQQKTGLAPGSQASLAHHPQIVLQQQHLLKQRQLGQQQQQIRQPQKTVYATVPSHPHQLVVSGGSTTVKMTPQIQAQITQLVAQQKQQRRMSNKQAGTSTGQPPVTLTVTKLLQSSGASTIRHTLVPHNTAQLSQQVTQLPLSVATSIVTQGAMATHQQGMMTQQQRQQIHMPRVCQAGASQAAAVVGSTPLVMQRPSVVAVSNQVQHQQHRLRNTSPGVAPQMNIQISTPQPGVVISGKPSTPSSAGATSTSGDVTFNIHPMSR